VNQPLAPLLGLAFTLYALGVHGSRRSAVAGLVFVTAFLGVGTKNVGLGNFMFGAIFTWGTLLAGRAMRGRVRQTDELARRAEHDRLEAIASERARIARELHDVIAHSVSVMTVQAGAAEEMLKIDPARAFEPVRAVQETGRQALVEMKRLVGMLREGDHESGLTPQPGVQDLDRLLGQVRDAGLPVELRIHGSVRPLPLGIGLSVYRVVQEALTNALKHANANGAVVTLSYGDTELALEVADDGRGHAPQGGGHGLDGMRERLAVFGGSFEAGPGADSGFRVRATLPLQAAE
jgi:signal transduction histidine kinase